MTTSAVNENRRPPLTTLATRLISMTRSLSSRESATSWCSKLEPSFARALGERLHASVVQVAAAVEHAALDPGLLRGLRERLADRARLLGLRAPTTPSEFQPAAASVRPLGRRRAARRSRGSSGTRRGEAARPCRRPCRGRGGGGACAPGASSARSCALPDLPADLLVAVADALALVRLGRAHLADLGGGLADHLLVDALDDDLRRRRDVERDPLRGLTTTGCEKPTASSRSVPLSCAR